MSEQVSINSLWVRHQTGVRAAGMGVLVAVCVLWGILPLWSSIREKIAKIEIRRKEEQELTKKVAVLSQLDQNVLKDRLTVIDTALLPRKDVVAYLSAVDGLSRELGLSFGGLSLSPGSIDEASGSAKAVTTKSEAGLQSLDTTLKIQGNEDAIYSFLRSVEQMLPLMHVKDVKVTKVADGQYSLSLSLGMLWAPPTAGDIKGAVTLFSEKEEKYFQTLASYRRYDRVVGIDTGATGETKADLFAH